MFFDDRVNIINKANGLHNSVDRRIKFSVEEEHNGQLPFLDTLVTPDNGFLITSVYRPTHTDKYLHYTPHIRTKIVRSAQHYPFYIGSDIT